MQIEPTRGHFDGLLNGSLEKGCLDESPSRKRMMEKSGMTEPSGVEKEMVEGKEEEEKRKSSFLDCYDTTPTVLCSARETRFSSVLLPEQMRKAV